LRSYVEHSRELGRFRPEPLAPGTLLAGRYRIGAEVSSGGTAIIYWAQDEELGVERIVKAINRRCADQAIASDWEDLVRAEARTLAQLDSRNIVTVHDILRDGERSYIVMDRVRGRDLESLLKELPASARGDSRGAQRVAWLARTLGREPPGEHQDQLDVKDWYVVVARIVGRAVAALELAHGREIRHRDLKPANLLLVAGGEPVLLDFGFGVGPTTESTVEGKLIGTPEYMAPEQFRERRIGDDPRTDVYQIGVLLQEFATLRRPFERDAPGFLEDKLAGRIRPPRDFDARIPAALAAICRKATAGTVEERYASARQMRVDLERFEAGQPPLHADFPLLRKGLAWGRWAARKPVVLVAGAAVALLIGVATFLGPSWFPPALQGVKSEGGALVPVVGSEITVGPGGVALGLRVVASQTSVLYAFQIYGDDGDARYIRPLPSADGLGHKVTGSRNIALLELGEEERYARDGFVVLACARPNARIEQYMNDLREGAGTFETRVPFVEADWLALLDGRTRGVPLSKLTAEERAVLEGAFSPPEELRDEDYAKAGIKPYRFIYPVIYKEH
jgi:serine/threonine-protein kinase